MATGDISFYTKFIEGQFQSDAGGVRSNQPVDFEGDQIDVAVMVTAFTSDLTATSSQQHWDDCSASEVAKSTAYTGPITIATDTITSSGSTVTYDGVDITIAQDASGFTNGRWLLFMNYNATTAQAPLIATGDLGSDRSIVSGSLTFSWNASGIFTVA